MPLYEFLNHETGEKISQFFKLGTRPEEITVDEVEYKYCISAPSIVGGVGGLKVPGNLKDRLAQIKKANPGMKSSVV